MRQIDLSIVEIIPATLDDYPTIQNMAQFYVYDASRECGFIMSDNGLYEPNDYKNYFNETTKKAFLIKYDNELTVFELLNTIGISNDADWKVDQFFILAKFQNKGVGKEAIKQIWQKYPGNWEVSVFPENKSALSFWRKVIHEYTDDYQEEIKTIDYDEHQPKRYIINFTKK